ncbi:uncharacterized protein LOC113147378 [Cyclospora cayetanensis]|uniref:Uncharacterized protein LOC113147378 n=1 Tax=Cyclospora cayetanensis TaxID=88456 RepID=A0A6P6S2I9_9EIME|nr:uncharacterized protein LOC113147378 [Cyclospora cayetanensis]
MLNQIRTQRRHGHLLPRSKVVEQKKIKEIIFAGRCVIVVTEGGVCRAYDTKSTRFLADLNPGAPWKKITTAIYHAKNDTVVVVFEPNPGGLQCQVFIASVTNVVLSHPAFFEFDEANGVILAAQQGDVQSFQFWNHTKFKLVFSVHGEEYEAVFDVEDGRRVAEISIPIDQYRRVEFLELLVSKLLFKQERASLRVIDLLNNGASIKVPHTRDSFSPVGFVFFEVPERVMGKKYLDQRARRFFTISLDTVQFWILEHNRLDKLYSIRIPGLREAGLCQQCMGTNLLAICPSHGQNMKCEISGSSDVAFVSALELHQLKRPGGVLKGFHPTEPVPDQLGEPTKRGLKNSGDRNILFFSLEDGQYIGSVSSHLCGENVEVLQMSAENMV